MIIRVLNPILIGIGTIIGGTIGVIASAKEETTKDEIIEDLSEKYNELVDSINRGTLDDLEDIEIPENADENDDDGKDIEIRLGVETPDDVPEIEYYPGAFIDDCTGVQNRVQNLYTDIENCNDGEIEAEEDALLDEVNAAVAMICTAYQSAYVHGLSTYDKVLKDKIKAIRKLPNYDSSVKENKASLIKEINSLLEKSNKLNNNIKLNKETKAEEAEEPETNTEDFVVPVYHKQKKGAV